MRMVFRADGGRQEVVYEHYTTIERLALAKMSELQDQSFGLSGLVMENEDGEVCVIDLKGKTVYKSVIAQQSSSGKKAVKEKTVNAGPIPSFNYSTIWADNAARVPRVDAGVFFEETINDNA